MTAQEVHLLIVEDSEDDALLLLREIRRGGLNPIWERVDSPQALNQALLRGGWDAVLSDDSLPHINGLTALAMVRSKYPDLPFFIVSGTLSEELAGAAMDAGATDSFFKGRWARLVPALRRELRTSAERSVLRQKEIKVSEERMRLLNVIQSANCPILVCDGELRVAMANPAAERLMGTSQLRMLHQPIANWIGDPDRAGCVALLHQLLQRPQLSHSPDAALGCWHLRTELGDSVPVEVSFSGVELQGRRHLTLVMREASAREGRVSVEGWSEDRFRRMAEEAPVPIFLTSPEGELLFANRRWRELTGLSQEQVRGTGFDRVVHPEDRDRLVSEWERAAAGGREFTAVYRLRGGDGVFRPQHGRFVVLKDESGRVTGRIGTAGDPA